jgi:hypothetical protein
MREFATNNQKYADAAMSSRVAAAQELELFYRRRISELQARLRSVQGSLQEVRAHLAETDRLANSFSACRGASEASELFAAVQRAAARVPELQRVMRDCTSQIRQVC